MREIVEQGSEEGCDDENFDDVGAVIGTTTTPIFVMRISYMAQIQPVKRSPYKASLNLALSLSFELMSKEPATRSASAFSFPSKRL